MNATIPTVASQLHYAFNPASIAVVGASDDKSKMGGRVLSAIIANRYKGKLYPINPRGGIVQGVDAFPSIEAIGSPIDFVIICVPQALALESLETAGKAGARAAVIFASGYAELDAAGARAQEQLVAVARKYSIALIGPNCLGLINGNTGMAATSSIMMDFLTLTPGKAALATQSGALGSYWLDSALAAGIGAGKWVSTGNEAATTFVDVLDYLVDDQETGIVSAYVEGVRDGLSFRRVLEKAAAKRKPVVILKSGRTGQGAKAVASHTGSLAGEDEVSGIL